MRKEEIRTFRFSMGFSQEQFAVWLGVSSKTVSRWETGKHNPSALATERLKALKERDDGVTDIKNCNE